jgi:hypothetical protein
MFVLSGDQELNCCGPVHVSIRLPVTDKDRHCVSTKKLKGKLLAIMLGTFVSKLDIDMQACTRLALSGDEALPVGYCELCWLKLL